MMWLRVISLNGKSNLELTLTKQATWQGYN